MGQDRLAWWELNGRASVFGFSGLGFRVLGFRVFGLGFWGLRVQGLGFRRLRCRGWRLRAFVFRCYLEFTGMQESGRARVHGLPGLRNATPASRCMEQEPF